MTAEELDNMIAKCIEAHETVMEHGTPEMQAFSKALLYALAHLIASDIQGSTDGYGTK